MALRWSWLVIDADDPRGLAAWWAEVLGWRAEDGAREGWVALHPPAPGPPALLFLPVPERKTSKNRLHLDLTPDDQDAEVARLESLGARRVDIGQGEQTWVVLADPEGNELCVLRGP